MKLPRDVCGPELARALSRYGYRVTRQVGSHMRLTTTTKGEHHLTIPAHDVLRPGTLEAILTSAAFHLGLSRAALEAGLFGTGN